MKLLFMFCFCSALVHAQMHDNVWTLGYSCNPDDTTRFGGTNLYFQEVIESEYTCRDLDFKNNLTASISDKEGNLLMMFNGCTLTDAADNIVSGSENLVRNDTNIEQTWWCLGGYNTPHGAFFLPDPYDEYTYHLFYRDILQIDEQPSPISDSLYVAKILIENNVPYVLHKHLLDDSGVHLHSSQRIGTQHYVINGGNTTRFSPDGKFFVSLYPFGNLDVFMFNRYNGEFTEYLSIPFWDDPTNSLVINTEFSPSGRFLYIAEVNTLYQFDMDVAKEDFSNSKTVVGEYDGFADPFPVNFWLMQTAPDGKIYMSARNSSKFLHTIHQPNEKGLDCDFRQHDYELPTLNARGMPYFPNFRLGPDSTSVSTVESKHGNFITIFPNPATNIITVRSSIKYDVFRIFDMNGRRVKTSYEKEIPIDDIPIGIYILKAYIDSVHSNSTKLIVAY